MSEDLPSRPMYLPVGWTPRPEQTRLFHEIVDLFESGKKVVMLDAPTGIGKSAIARALLQHFGTGLIVTATKQLQEQYARDFYDVPRLVGRGNFVCSIGRKTCEKGYYEKTPRKRSRSYCSGCPYQEHLDEALGSRFYTANYASAIWTAKGDAQRGILILDEGHRVETELMSQHSLRISQDWMERLDIPVPEDMDDHEGLVDWAKSFYRELKIYGTIEHAAEKERILSALSHMFATLDQLSWVSQGENQKLYDNYVEFKPLRLSRMQVNKLFAKGERVLIMSATILDPNEVARGLRLGRAEWEYVQSNKAFNPETRPVRYFSDALPVTRSTRDISEPWLSECISFLLEEHPDVKGLIHTASTRLASFLKYNVEDPDERLLLAYGANRSNNLQRHIDSTEPTVLLSPSMAEGVDLRDDLARFIIVSKCPFMSLGDKQVFKRQEVDYAWYKIHAIRQIIQACGRGNRSAEDQCITYVLDAKIPELLEENSDIVPEWFWDAWEEVDL